MPQSNGQPTLRCRLASEADAETVARLHLASWRDAYRGFVPAAFLETQDLAARVAYWREQLASPGVAVLLAESPHGLAGFCACGPSRESQGSVPSTWEIYHLHVAPLLRSQGIGARLFADAAERGARGGFKALTLWVIAPNVAARRFYSRQGMETDGAEQTRMLGGGPKVSEVRYRLELPAVPQSSGTARPAQPVRESLDRMDER